MRTAAAGEAREGIHPISHTADTGFRLVAGTREQVFVLAAQALYGVITDRRRIRAREQREVTAEAPDQAALLVAWLNELLYLLDTTGFLGKNIRILELTAHRLKAAVAGESRDPERHVDKTAVKAATYHRLSLQRTPAGWEATIILDL